MRRRIETRECRVLYAHPPVCGTVPLSLCDVDDRQSFNQRAIPNPLSFPPFAVISIANLLYRRDATMSRATVPLTARPVQANIHTYRRPTWTRLGERVCSRWHRSLRLQGRL